MQGSPSCEIAIDGAICRKQLRANALRASRTATMRRAVSRSSVRRLRFPPRRPIAERYARTESVSERLALATSTSMANHNPLMLGVNK